MDNQEFDHLKWTSHFTVESAPADLNDGDKIILPASALEQLLLKVGHSGSLPSPLTFELRHPHSNEIIHCGVKEFSSEGNTTQLPSWIMSALGLQQGDHVLIKLVILPKGTWTNLQPISTDYQQIADYRAALEAHLRAHYNTLTKGQVLSCRYGGRTYQFKVLDLKPQNAVSITDTDLEVDIKHDVAKDDVQTDIPIVQINDTLRIEIPSGYKYWKLALNNNRNVSIKLTVEAGDADIVCSTEKTPTLDNHEWSDLSSDNQRSLNLENLKSTHLHVGIHAYDKNTTVSWQAVPFTTVNMEVDEEDTTGKEQCKNCHAWVSQRSLVLHENFCLRNNVICSWGCGKVFKKDSQEFKDHWHCEECDYAADSDGPEKHIEYYHTPKKCTCTHFVTNSYEALAEHKRTTCPDKLITCRYCHILTAQGVMSLDSRDRLLGLHSHESYCGSRTIICQKCNKPIPIKDIQVHAKIHEVKRQQQTLPAMCCNQNCIRPRTKNRLSFCQYCFGPFWITEDDPKNAKLIQRVARRLHSQLTLGCGNEWCRNKYCASFTKDPKDATTAASLLIPMIKSLPRQLALPNPSPQLYFCVDETTTRKKFLAELLASESNGKYDLGWCVKAIENEQEDLDRAKNWLNINAPYNVTSESK
ncbi:hypothetical protein INT47_000978 [Mucor saturninus]|uniref:Ubiquitin-protein ligase E3A N-terminal zinc-binding domain-containing protein n=1 Tax=Mucor saturninus TaxID=64648 RepID=A0A8H7RQI7_9FUNG|nr:hypothetical protein INT47_000978 [Mucor saturninus]